MKKTINIILGSIIIGLSYTIFFIPNNLIANGIFGLSQFSSNLLELNPGIIILAINIILLFFGLLILGYEDCKRYFITSITIPLVVFISYNYTWKINLSTMEPIVLVIAGSYLMGYGYSLIHKYSSNVGGFSIIDDIINNYRPIKNKEFSYIIETIIIIVTFLTYGFESSIYTLMIIIIINYMSTKSKIGISTSKTFYIITTHEKEIKDYLIKELHHDYTEFNVKGGYTNNKNKIIMTVVDTKDYYRVKQGINIIDDKAFIFIIDNYEVINKNVTINKKLKDSEK